MTNRSTESDAFWKNVEDACERIERWPEWKRKALDVFSRVYLLRGKWWFHAAKGEKPRGPFDTERECHAALSDYKAEQRHGVPWACLSYDRPPRHLDPREEIKDVMREMQEAMLGEGKGQRKFWTLQELAIYCKRVRDAAIERQLREVGPR